MTGSTAVAADEETKDYVQDGVSETPSERPLKIDLFGHIVTTGPKPCEAPTSAARVLAQRGFAMELSIREAKARFAEAATAAARGERVLVTKHGRPFVELVPARQASGMDFEKAAAVRRKLGLDGLAVGLPSHFDDPAFSRQVLGLEMLRLDMPDRED